MPIFETVETGSCLMDCFRFGEGKRTLVILPGLSVQSVTGAADAVEEAYRSLAEDFTVWVFDRRRDLPPSYPVSEAAKDTAEAIRAAGLERVCLFGASQGGMIAMKIAADCPGLAEKLLLGSAAARVTAKTSALLKRWIRLAEEKKAKELYLSFGEAIYPRSVFEGARGLLTDAAKTVTEEDLGRFSVLARGMRGLDLTGELSRIRCPVLAIADREDRVFDWREIEGIGRAPGGCPDFRFYLYEGYGHAVYDTAPDYKERMRRFFAD
ncbi:MAG: alpha/beta hydrolase [Clostridia bacterium]|nr:alpha/beta hydrolase [Clostridia bacterium]